MQVIYENVPSTISFRAFGTVTKEILESEKIVFIAKRYTNTTIATSVYFENKGISQNINWKIDGFKFHTVKNQSMFTGENQISNYFKISKKQGQEEYEKYITFLCSKLCLQFGVKEPETVHIMNKVF